MSKFDYRDFDLTDYIRIEEGSRGNEGMIYGNYLDWNEFRNCNEEELLAHFDVILPWGEELELFEYFEIIKQEVFEQTTIINDFRINDLEILNDSAKLSDIEVQFPEYNGEVVSKIFDYYEVPSRTDYEYDLPEELQYWHSMLEDDYQYYRRYPLEFDDYNLTLEEIRTKIQDTQDELTKKSLLLSSFIVSESLLKSMIVRMTPAESQISEFNSKLLDDTINKKLCGTVSERNQLFKSLFNRKAPDQDWTALRNSLAHDIEESRLENDEITYTNMKTGAKDTKSIENIFIKLKMFSSELEEILNSHN